MKDRGWALQVRGLKEQVVLAKRFSVHRENHEAIASRFRPGFVNDGIDAFSFGLQLATWNKQLNCSFEGRVHALGRSTVDGSYIDHNWYELLPSAGHAGNRQEVMRRGSSADAMPGEHPGTHGWLRQEERSFKGRYVVGENQLFCHPEMLLFRIWSLILTEDGFMIWDGQRRTALHEP